MDDDFEELSDRELDYFLQTHRVRKNNALAEWRYARTIYEDELKMYRALLSAKRARSKKGGR